jgi:hypothetical protein
MSSGGAFHQQASDRYHDEIEVAFICAVHGFFHAATLPRLVDVTRQENVRFQPSA